MAHNSEFGRLRGLGESMMPALTGLAPSITYGGPLVLVAASPGLR
jgi:hypothetical protein